MHDHQGFSARLPSVRGKAETGIQGGLKLAHHEYLEWPFFEERHRTLVAGLERWAGEHLCSAQSPDVDTACRKLVSELGAAGWLKCAIGGKAYGASSETIDTRAVCLIRETLARYSGLADFSFAMQGLGSGAISLYGG